MKFYHLFVDGSVDPTSKLGFGAYLLLENLDDVVLKNEIKSIRIENTSSSKLELQMILYLMKKMEGKHLKLKIYTDSNAIISLIKRKERLVKMDFHSKNMRLLNLHFLYKEFFNLYDPLMVEFIKLKGHSRANEKDYFDRYFSMVDKASRKALRIFLKKSPAS